MYSRYKNKLQTYWECKIAQHSGEPRKHWSTFNDTVARLRSGSCPTASHFSADAFLESYTINVRSVREDTADSLPVFPPKS